MNTNHFDTWRRTSPLEADEIEALDRFLQAYPKPLLACRELDRFKYRFEHDLNDVHGVAALVRYMNRLGERIREVTEDGENRSAEIAELIFAMVENGRDEGDFREVAEHLKRQVQLLGHPADRAFSIGTALLFGRGWIRVRKHVWGLTQRAKCELKALTLDAIGTPDAPQAIKTWLASLGNPSTTKAIHEGTSVAVRIGLREELT